MWGEVGEGRKPLALFGKRIDDVFGISGEREVCKLQKALRVDHDGRGLEIVVDYPVACAQDKRRKERNKKRRKGTRKDAGKLEE